MKAQLKVYFILAILFSGCEDPEYSVGPCEFAPASLDFAEVENFRPEFNCEDCFMNVEFNEEVYEFEESQFESGIYRGYTIDSLHELHIGYENALFEFWMLIPDSEQELLDAVNVPSPIVTNEELRQALVEANNEVTDYMEKNIALKKKINHWQGIFKDLI